MGTQAGCTNCRNEYIGGKFNINHWNLTEVPQDIPALAWRVDLSGNSITSLPTGAFSHLTLCTELNVANNMISTIQKGAFHGMVALDWLKLSANEIYFIIPGTFDHLSHLRVLLLDSNQISTIKSDMFKGLYFLHILFINFNTIFSIEAGAFDSLYSLKKLHLYHNRIKTLKPDLFINQPHPFELVLSESPEHRNDLICSSLCWLKHEEEHGTITWPDNMFPRCTDNVAWPSLSCGHSGGKKMSCLPQETNL